MDETGLRIILADHVKRVCQPTVFYGLPEHLARAQIRQLSDATTWARASLPEAICDADARAAEMGLCLERCPHISS